MKTILRKAVATVALATGIAVGATALTASPASADILVITRDGVTTIAHPDNIEIWIW